MDSVAIQVDFDQIGVELAYVLLFSQVIFPISAGRLVAGTKELDNRDNAITAFAVDDFEKGFGDRFLVRVDHERLRHGDAALLLVAVFRFRAYSTTRTSGNQG